MKNTSFVILVISLMFLVNPISSASAKPEIILEVVYQDEEVLSEFEKIAWDQNNTYVVSASYYNDLYGRDFPILYTSNDGGETWEVSPVPFGNRPEGNYLLQFESIFWDGQRFVAVDSQGTILVSDEKGHNWEVVAEPSLEIAYWWDSMYMVDGKYIGSAVTMVLEQRDPIVRGQRVASIFESEDLKNWKYIKLQVEEGVDARPYYSFHSLAGNDETMVIGGDFSRLAYKKDGKMFEKVIYNEHPDGNTEVQKREHYDYKGDISDIIWNGKEFILALNRNQDNKSSVIHSSKDGFLWNKISELEVYSVRGLVDTGYGTIVFGQHTSPSNFIGFSTDNKDWDIKVLEEEDTINDVLWNGKEIIAVGSSIFRVKLPQELYYHDFEEGQYWSQNMLWAIKEGYVSGYKENGKYLIKPHKTLSEAEAVTILYRYFEPDEMESTIPETEWWASVPYQLAEKDGLDTVASYLDRTGSEEAITRGKLAQMLASKHFGKNVPLNEAVQFMYDSGVTSGYPDKDGNISKTFESYGADNILERAHIVSFIKRYHDNLGKFNGR